MARLGHRCQASGGLLESLIPIGRTALNSTYATQIVWKPSPQHWNKLTVEQQWETLAAHGEQLYGWTELPEVGSRTPSQWIDVFLLPWALGRREATITVEWCMTLLGDQGLVCEAKFQHWKFDLPRERWLSHQRACGLKHCRYCLVRTSHLHAVEASEAFGMLGYDTVYRYEFDTREEADRFCKNMTRTDDAYISVPFVLAGKLRVSVYTTKLSDKQNQQPWHCDLQTVETMIRADLLETDVQAKTRISRNRKLRSAIAEVQEHAYEVIRTNQQRREGAEQQDQQEQKASKSFGGAVKEVRKDRFGRKLADGEVFVHQQGFINFMVRMGLSDGLDARGFPMFRAFKPENHTDEEVREYEHLIAGGTPDEWIDQEAAKILNFKRLFVK